MRLFYFFIIKYTKFWYGFKEAVKIRFINAKNFAVFQCLYIINTGLMVLKTFQVANPPFFKCEIDDYFFAVIIYHIPPETSFVYISPYPAYFSGTQQVFFPLYTSPFKIRERCCYFFIC